MATCTNKETTSPPNKDNHEEREEHRLPIFTVVKNGAILKNIYLINHSNPSSLLDGPHPISQDIITVGRHPDCDIVLMHPSISRFHLQITTNPSSHRLFVTDLSSVHGSWVSDRKIEPGLQVELKDGDTIRVGGSTRLYRLHWIPLSSAFDSEKPFFSVSDVAAVEDNEEEFTNPAEGNPGEISQEKSFGVKGELMNGSVGPNDNEEECCESVKGDAVEMSKELFRGICALNDGFVDSDDDENLLFLAPDSVAVENRKEYNYPVELETGLELSQEKLFDADGALSYNISGQNDNEHPPFLVFHVAAVEKNEEEYPQSVEFRNDIESDTSESLCPLQLANSHDEGSHALRQEGDCSLLIGRVCTEPLSADSLDSFSPVAEMMFELTTNVESQTMESDVISTMGTMESFEIEGPETFCPMQLAYEAEAKEKITENGTFNAGVSASFHNDGNNVLGQGGDYVLLTGSVCVASPAAQPLDSFSSVTEIMSEITDLVESQTSESNGIATMESMEIFGSPSSRCGVISSSSDIGSRGSKLCTSLQAQAYSSKRKVRRLAGTGCEFYSEKQRATKGGLWVKALCPQLGTTDDEIFLSDKENFSPNTLFMKKLREEGNTKVVQALNFCRFSSSKDGFNLNEEMIASKDKENQNPGALQKRKSKRLTFKNQNEADMLLQERRSKRVTLQSLPTNSMGNSKSESLAPGNQTDKSSSVRCSKLLENKVKLTGIKKGEWIIVADTTSLLDKESRKSLQLLQGLKGTRLVIPRTVTTELEYLRQCGNFFRRTTEASLALGWIEECLINSKWWILVQISAEDGRESAPTSLASSNQQSRNSNSKTSRLLPFLDCWSRSEIHSPIVEDHVLHCALQYRRMSSVENFVLLSNNISLNIKAMAEGLFCETAQEFRQSLVSPFSERFMWAGSSPRGQTWTVFDDVVLKERYSKKSMGCAKGLQLFL